MSETSPDPDTPALPDVAAIVQAQREQVLRGRARDPAFRREQLARLKALLRAHEQPLMEAIQADLHKAPFETYETELGFVHHEIDLAMAGLERWSRPRKVRTNLANFPSSSFVMPEPYGTTLVIGAWNYPYQLTLAPLVAAMAAGNTCIVKPSELPRRTSAALARLINDGFDPAYLHVIEGGVEATQALLACRFDKIFFTGSTKVGRIVARAAAEHLTPVTLELGGKSPCFVFADADIEQTARRIAWGKFLNAGQTCIAPDYVLVERSVCERLLQALATQIPLIAGADPRSSDSFIRIVDIRNVRRLARLIDPAKVYAGGEVDEGERYVAPTLLRDVGWDDPIMQEEIFGPLLPVIPFDDLGATIAAVKSRPKPLSLYLFSRSRATQRRLLDELSFGGGCINDVIMHISNPNLPFGGVGDSGTGSYHAEAGFRAFSHFKSVMRKPFGFEPPVRYPPYRDWKLKLLKKLLG